MDFCGEFVTHRTFGRGQIIEINNDCLTVLFEAVNEKKKFIYPSSIGTFLLLENKKLAKQVLENKNKIAQAKETEKNLAESQRQEEKLAALNQAKLAKKTAKKKPAVKSPRKSK